MLPPEFPPVCERPAVGGPPATWLGVWMSLLLILLAVFIVLGARAQPQADRTQAAFDSVAARFSSANAHQPRIADARRAAAASALAALATALPGLLLDGPHQLAAPSALAVRVRIPVATLYTATDDGIRGDASGHLDRIAAAASAMPAGYRLSIVAVVPALADPDRFGADSPRAEAQALALGDALVGHGLPAGSVSVGVDERADGVVVFDFAAETAY
ncbi:MAG: hypothetical protein MUE49_08370 [Rhodospirillales bacterium]|nr:hypothetical protein [Rhodospirillales bacterium]